MSGPWDDYAAPSDVAAMVTDEAQRQNVDPALALRLAHHESGLNQGAVSPKGAIGVMQLEPGTAQDLGVDPADLRQNIHGGVKYLRQQLDAFNGNPQLAAAAYNAGPGAVIKHGGVPPYAETQKYVDAVAPQASADDTPPWQDYAALTTPAAVGSDVQAPSVINSETGKPYNPAQEAAYATRLRTGEFNPNATPGSQAFPRGLTDANDRPDPGSWYVDLDGGVKQAPGLAKDTGLGLLSGLGKGVSGIGDLVEQASPLGALDNIMKSAAGVGLMLNGKGAQAPASPFSVLSDATARTAYQPVTDAGHLAETVGTMLPNALLPGSAAARVANVITPALGQVTGEGLAQRGGADQRGQQLAGMLGATLGGGLSSLRMARPDVIPSVSLEDTRNASQKAWNAVDASTYQVPAPDVKAAAKTVADNLEEAGGADLYPKAALISKRFTNLADKGSMTVGQLNRLKSQSGTRLLSPGSDEVDVGGHIRDTLEDLIVNSQDPTIQPARDLYARLKKMEAVDAAVGSADVSAGGAKSIPNKLRPLIDPKSSQRLRTLTPDEASAIRAIVKPGIGGRVAQGLSTMRLSGPVSGPIMAMLALPTHGISAGLGAAGNVAKALRDVSTAKSVQALVDMMSAGGTKPAASLPMPTMFGGQYDGLAAPSSLMLSGLPPTASVQTGR